MENIDFVSEARIKAGNKVYFINDGFYYYAHKTLNETFFVKCVCNRTARCPGRMMIPNAMAQRTINNVRFGARPHNHPPMQQWFEREAARYRCVQRSAGEATQYRDLYNQETLRLPVNVAADLPYQAVGQAMYRARRKANLVIPGSLQEYGEILLNNPRFFTKEVEAPRAFYRATLTDDNGGVAVVFVSPTIEGKINAATSTLQVDGTFKTVPRVPASYQLMTMAVILFDHAYPVVSALMSNKSQALYELVFAYVREHLDRLQPTNVICDFEQALQNALRSSWPDATVVGCWYHSANCMNKSARRLGMTNLIANNLHAKRVFKMCQSLALLPADQIPVQGFGHIQGYAEQHGLMDDDLIQQFLDYVNRIWIQGVGAQSLSVFKQKDRTNNNLEAYHRRLKDMMGHPHPNIWVFTDRLISMERERAINYTSLSQLRNPYRAPRRLYRQTDERIRPPLEPALLMHDHTYALPVLQ